jgi:hypothetical protein
LLTKVSRGERQSTAGRSEINRIIDWMRIWAKTNRSIPRRLKTNLGPRRKVRQFDQGVSGRIMSF